MAFFIPSPCPFSLGVNVQIVCTISNEIVVMCVEKERREVEVFLIWRKDIR